jgi:hypothetical protein
MTIATCWIRRVGGGEQLVFTSDSRLSGGRYMDFAPKIFAFPRDDCAMCFAGSTDWAYPMLVQTVEAVKLHGPTLDRAVNLSSFKRHVLRVLNAALEFVETDHAELEQPEVEFLFGGYCWARHRFHMWRFHYVHGSREFRAAPAEALMVAEGGSRVVSRRMRKPWRESRARLLWGGDVAREAREALLDRMTQKIQNGGYDLDADGLAWEPFEVVRDMLRDPGRSVSIGGAPQVVCVYPNLQCKTLGVIWDAGSGEQVHVLGRQLLPYETTDTWNLDPDALRLSHPLHGDVKASSEVAGWAASDVLEE